MDAKERQRLVGVIKSFANSINCSRRRAESARLQLQNLHLASEHVEKVGALAALEKEIENIE